MLRKKKKHIPIGDVTIVHSKGVGPFNIPVGSGKVEGN
jgi:hypothetical protein